MIQIDIFKLFVLLSMLLESRMLVVSLRYGSVYFVGYFFVATAESFWKSFKSLLYIQNTYDFQHGKVMEKFPWLARRGSMLSLCKLVINHYGWTRGMVKYPWNASRIAIWTKTWWNLGCPFGAKLENVPKITKKTRPCAQKNFLPSIIFFTSSSILTRCDSKNWSM